MNKIDRPHEDKDRITATQEVFLIFVTCSGTKVSILIFRILALLLSHEVGDFDFTPSRVHLG